MTSIFGPVFVVVSSFVSPQPSFSISLETGYHHLLGEVVLTPIGDHAVRIIEDRNRCTFNRFGELHVCTQEPPLIYTSRLQLINEKPGKKVFSLVESENLLVAVQDWRLRLLKADGNGNVVAVYDLKERPQIELD